MISLERSRSVNAGPRNIAARRLIGGALSFVAAVSMTGCYAFIPTTSTTLAPATPITVELTLGGTVNLADRLGQNVTEVEGRVVRSTADSLVMTIDNTYTTQKQKFASSGTEVALPRLYLQDVKVRTFSRKRTVLLIAGTAAAAAAAAASVAAGTSSSSGTNGGGTTPASVQRP